VKKIIIASQFLGIISFLTHTISLTMVRGPATASYSILFPFIVVFIWIPVATFNILLFLCLKFGIKTDIYTRIVYWILLGIVFIICAPMLIFGILRLMNLDRYI